jgi:hydrogenase nickel incorporation protein HypB
MFSVCDLVLVNKIDAVALFDFDFKAFDARVRAIKPEIDIINVSAKTGEGFQAVANWISDKAQSVIK